MLSASSHTDGVLERLLRVDPESKPAVYLQIFDGAGINNLNYWLELLLSAAIATVDGVRRFDILRNSRMGGTVSIPLTRRQSLKAAYSFGAYTTIGGDFRSTALAYQYLWGGGL